MADDTLELFVPGRLCIVGEHSDWSGAMRKYNHELIPPGRTIVAGLTYGLYAKVRTLEERVLRLRSTTEDGKIFQTELSLDEDVLAAEAQGGGFFQLCCWRCLRVYN
ncbi:hypothetical protein Ndes2526B_g02068 [Nannochloris sp. 'desiccata']